MSTVDTRVIEVFADVWCPFAHVGLRVVAEQRRLAGRTDVPMIVRAWPLELVNGAPMNPAKTEEHIHHLREQVAPDLFRGFNPTTFPRTTIPALALVSRAYRHGTGVGEQMSFAVRDALFEEGRDISDPAVLEALAERYATGMPDARDTAAVTEDWHQGQRRGVVGSPHFFCGGEVQAFCPSLDITRDPEHGMSINLDTSGVCAFIDRCLSA